MLKPILSILLLMIFSFSHGQSPVSENVDLLDNWDNNDLKVRSGLSYNDIWGYVDSEGNEYGIIGTVDSTLFIDMSDPTDLKRIAGMKGAGSSIWRDFKTYLHYGYGVADEGVATLQIFDLSDLPNSVTKVFDSNQFFSTCHNIFIDEQHGRLYAVGTGSANVVILDLTQDPANPTLLKNRSLPRGYVHDIYVRDHIAYASHIYDASLYVYDLSDVNTFPVLTLGSLTEYDFQHLNHSSWLSENGEVLLMADENKNYPMKVVDMTDLSDITVSAYFKSTLEAPTATNSIPHNPYVIGNKYTVISYYHDGVQIYDISDPTNPTRAGYYDTYNNSNYSGSVGAWGVFPFLPSGNIIASDINNGFFAVKPTFDLGYCRKNLYTAETVENGETKSIHAEEAIHLRNGFVAENGSEFSAKTQSCAGGSALKDDQDQLNNSKELENVFQPVKQLIDKLLREESVLVFPNPFASEFRVEWARTGSTSLPSIQLINSLGQLIPTQNIACGDGCIRVETDALPAGMYTVFIQQKNQAAIAKQVIKMK